MSPLTRRELLKAGAASAGAVAMPAVTQAANAATTPTPLRPPVRQRVSLEVNGETVEREVDTRTTLLDFLREELHLTGTKKGCDHGQCGACTAIVDGRRINTCLSLAVMNAGAKVTTIEGLGTPEKLHPMQAAFVKHDGFQCGYCTPGQICSAVAVLGEIRDGIPSHVTTDLTARPAISGSEIRERMSGNLCRCGAYANILDAIEDVAGTAGARA
ncbi:aldehyde dehydrogenase iron-sulfur subunit [Luteimonas fraxinea]|uniref:Aldehyde dehydrogenase iron-sulfur subunit n=2 Tax=Luteimonas fraxinea TaxID=2901869 RepID=A0ABS8UJ22_9GAMM|nr:aldehyde dehydrogenase iron-sulfur subunit PaoA [Luteimonas fraxinea]MCD9098731.1 aldehyde dehydrogenase iron-sulfur subunit [Luteimonas fraxinea]MCD9125569.1 aldehyde dehydrogenase iron-sulfur subunit [Luteimonas fraxinea]UHH10387.1 aldehyde dehydrogenase iron-sulfur subunit [Luteimonas fraxinea]